MAAHRYWRIYVTESYGTTAHQCGCLWKWYDMDQNEISLTGLSLLTSGDNASYPTSNLNSSTSTYQQWSGTSVPQYCGVDFGAGTEKEIGKVFLQSHSSYYTRMPKAFSFQYSDDASSWTTVKSYSNEIWNSTYPSRTYSVGLDLGHDRVTQSFSQVVRDYDAGQQDQVTQVFSQVIRDYDAGQQDQVTQVFVQVVYSIWGSTTQPVVTVIL